MKTLTLPKTHSEIINYIKSHKQKEELYIEYYRKNNVILACELLNNIKLFPLNETLFQKSIINEKLLKIDLFDIFTQEKEDYLKINNSKEIQELDIYFEEEDAFYLTKDINLYQNGILKFIVGFNYDENEFFSSVTVEEDIITPCREYSALEKNEEKNSKQWINDYLIENKEILTKNISIKIDNLNAEKIRSIIKNFIHDYDKIPLKISSVLPLFNHNQSYIKQLFENKGLLSYKEFKKGYTIKNESNIFHLYHFPSLYLNCLYKDIINYLNENNNNIFSLKGTTMNIIPINLRNSNYQQILKCDYNLFFEGESLNDKIHLYSDKKLIMSISAKNGEMLPELLLSFMENDIQNKIRTSLKGKVLLEMESKIKFQIGKSEIDIKANFQKRNEIFKDIKKDIIPIKVIYKNYDMNSLFNNDNIAELKNEIESFIEKVSLDEVFVNINSIKKNHRL